MYCPSLGQLRFKKSDYIYTNRLKNALPFWDGENVVHYPNKSFLITKINNK